MLPIIPLVFTVGDNRRIHRKLVVIVTMRRQNSELFRSMSKKADLPLTILTVFARLGPVASRVKPTLKHPVGELAVISPAAAAAAKLGADGAGVMVPSGIPSASFLAGMGERAVGPVVAAAARAAAHLELVDAEMIGRVGVGVVVVEAVVVGEEFLEESFIGGSGRIQKYVGGIGG